MTGVEYFVCVTHTFDSRFGWLSDLLPLGRWILSDRLDLLLGTLTAQR